MIHIVYLAPSRKRRSCVTVFSSLFKVSPSLVCSHKVEHARRLFDFFRRIALFLPTLLFGIGSIGTPHGTKWVWLLLTCRKLDDTFHDRRVKPFFPSPFNNCYTPDTKIRPVLNCFPIAGELALIYVLKSIINISRLVESANVFHNMYIFIFSLFVFSSIFIQKRNIYFGGQI